MVRRAGGSVDRQSSAAKVPTSVATSFLKKRLTTGRVSITNNITSSSDSSVRASFKRGEFTVDGQVFVAGETMSG